MRLMSAVNVPRPRENPPSTSNSPPRSARRSLRCAALRLRRRVAVPTPAIDRRDQPDGDCRDRQAASHKKQDVRVDDDEACHHRDEPEAKQPRAEPQRSLRPTTRDGPLAVHIRLYLSGLVAHQTRTYHERFAAVEARGAGRVRRADPAARRARDLGSARALPGLSEVGGGSPAACGGTSSRWVACPLCRRTGCPFGQVVCEKVRGHPGVIVRPLARARASQVRGSERPARKREDGGSGFVWG